MRSFFITLSTIILLSACANPSTIYQPAKKNGSGFTEQRIETNRYIVGFVGEADADSAHVQSLAMRRAAELTNQNGYDWFKVIRHETVLASATRNNGTSVGVSAGGGSRGFSGVGVGIGIDLTPNRRSYESTLEIIMLEQSDPSDSQIYSAQNIISNSHQ